MRKKRQKLTELEMLNLVQKGRAKEAKARQRELMRGNSDSLKKTK